MPIIKNPKTIGSEYAKTDFIFGTTTEINRPSTKKNSCINNIVKQVRMKILKLKTFVLKTSAEKYETAINTMFVARIIVSAASNFDINTLYLEIGFESKKSAVLPDISLERIPVPKFIAWILPTNHKYVSIYPKKPKIVKNDPILIPNTALTAGGKP
jgi:hypothetical protein